MRDICDSKFLSNTLKRFQPNAIIHFAAESHVDRSIDQPMEFIQTNIVGTATLLMVALDYWERTIDKENNQLNERYKRLRDVEITIPSILKEELETNPFLRAKTIEEFKLIRKRKDEF